MSGSSLPEPKGNEVNSPQARSVFAVVTQAAQSRRRGPLEEFSFLFNGAAALEVDYPARRLPPRKSASPSEASGASTPSLENLSATAHLSPYP